MHVDELLVFADESDATEPQGGTATAPSARWRVLVVDDDRDVHDATQFALADLAVAGRQVELLHAYSAAEGVQVLKTQADIAVILLDVVMETEDAGLEMVRIVRHELALDNVRIILRTGQPGHAPELETIRAYDINDYKTKSELTRTRLFATLTTALRAYEQLCKLEQNRKGLEKIVEASNQLMVEHGLHALAEGVLTQIASLLGIHAEGVVCAGPDALNQPPGTQSDYVVIAAAGSLSPMVHRRLDELNESHVRSCLVQALEQKATVVSERSVTLYFDGDSCRDFAAYIGARMPLKAIDTRLLEVFCKNISLCASNVALIQRMQELAYVDRLLGLPNRVAFIDRIDHLAQTGALVGVTLAKVDLDNFSGVNDTLGYRVGDSLLGAVAQRLEQMLGSGIYIARLHGNTFGLIGSGEAINPERLQRVFADPFDVEGSSRRISASMGLLTCDDHMYTTPSTELVENVFVALKKAKAAGEGGAVYYTVAMGAESKDRAKLVQGLHKAFDHDRLFLVYQPKVDVLTGRPVGLEALMRWRAEDGSLVPPDRFIPVAEQSGLIVTLGQWAIDTALSTCIRLRDQGYGHLLMSVNVSAAQLAQPEFVETVLNAVGHKRVDPDQLELEVTESVALMGLDRVAGLLQKLRDGGISIAIDDFGTGFSSLSYLDRLPADRVKIDRAFVDQLDTASRGSRIARLIVPLGHQIGMKVVAEGVESAEQVAVLRDLGCDEAQGYYFGKPMELGTLMAWLSNFSQPSPLEITT